MTDPSGKALAPVVPRGAVGQIGGVGEGVTSEATFCDEEHGVFAVMTGHPRSEQGGRAVRCVTQALRTHMAGLQRAVSSAPLTDAGWQRLRNVFLAVFEEASQTVIAGVAPDDEGRLAFASASVAVIVDGKAAIAHGGKTRAYFLRDGRIVRVTRDHAPPADVAAARAGRGDPARHVGAAEVPAIEGMLFRVRAGDRLVLVSEGVATTVRGEEIRRAHEHTEAADALASAVAARGGEKADPPEAVAVVVDIVDAPPEPVAATPPAVTMAPGAGQTVVDPSVAPSPADGPRRMNLAEAAAAVMAFTKGDEGAEAPTVGLDPRPTPMAVKVMSDDSPHATAIFLPPSDQDVVDTRHDEPSVRDALCASRLFEGLGDAAFAQLEEASLPLTLHPGEPLFERGEAADRLFVVVSGHVVLESDGVQMEVLSAGQVVGASALVDEQRRRTGARASDHAKVQGLRRVALDRLVADRPADGVILYRNLARILLERGFVTPRPGGGG